MSDHDGDGEETDADHYYETDAESGRIVEKYPDKAFIEAVIDHNGASTGQIASTIGCTRRLARERLKTLAEDDAIRKLDTDAGFTWLPKGNEQ